MPRYFTSFRLFLSVVLLCLGAIAAQPACAGVSISSITMVPSTIPAVGGAMPVLITCTNVTGVPTGTATLTDSTGTVLSQNTCSLYDYDANGNPVIYTYLVVQPNKSITTPAFYTVNAVVTDQFGSTSQLSATFQQSFGNPIIINSVTTTPSPLLPSSTSVLVDVDLTANGPNQKGFYKGQVTLTNGAGTILDIEPLWGPSGNDSSGNPIYYTTVANMPANTTSSPQTYTVAVSVMDKAGVTVLASATVTQPAGSVTVAPPILPTALSVSNVSGTVGQSVSLAAALTRTTDSGALSGQSVSFTVDGTAVGTATTNGSGVAMQSYTIASAGSHTIAATYAGSSGYSGSSGMGALSGSVAIVPTALSVSNANGVVGQSASLTATLTRTSDGGVLGGKSVTFQIDGAVVGTVAASGSGIASFSYTLPASLGQGSHTITASFAGDSSDGSSSGTAALIVTVPVSPVATTLSVSNVSGTVGQSVTLSATLTANGGALSGQSASFTVDGTAVGTATTNGSGVAALPYAVASAGSHTITTTYAGSSADNASSATGTLTASSTVSSSVLTQIRYCPRTYCANRMVGGKFQGSLDGVNYTTLSTITATPTQGRLTTLPISTATVYRYLRYLAPNGSYGDIAELEFDSGTGSSLVKLTGTPFGTPGSYRNSGNTFDKVFDGSTATYFDAPSANGDFVGIDLGSGVH